METLIVKQVNNKWIVENYLPKYVICKLMLDGLAIDGQPAMAIRIVGFTPVRKWIYKNALESKVRPFIAVWDGCTIGRGRMILDIEARHDANEQERLQTIGRRSIDAGTGLVPDWDNHRRGRVTREGTVDVVEYDWV